MFFEGVRAHNSVLFHTRYHLTPPRGCCHEAVSLLVRHALKMRSRPRFLWIFFFFFFFVRRLSLTW